MVVMRGEQYHHNNPSLLCDNLYLCAARAINSKVMLELGITCVINATLEMPTFAYQKQECMQIAVEDRVCAKLYVYFDMVADKIHSVLTKGGVVMIYCRAGMSRSATLCIAYFMKHHGMSREDAYQFVRERRPIICPNPGFVRQLREYEAKLKFRNSGIKRKFEESQFSYAEYEEISAFEVLDFDSLSKIKPRPKPRIMKPSLFVPDPTGEFGQIAQSYTITPVGTCMPENQATEAKAPPPPGPVPSKASRKGARPKRPVSTPVRPRTPANVPSSPQNWAYHDPMVVAESSEADLRETAPPLTVKKGSLKKRPFSKISEPTKVAVSFQTIPWALCDSFEGHKANFTAEVPRYTVFADLHLPLAQKSQEIAFECAPIGLQMVKNTSTTSTQNFLASKAKVKVTAPRSISTQFKPVICDCPGLYATQPKVDYFRQNVPSRFAKSRATIKLPGVKISPIPDEYKKRPVPNLDLNFLHVSQSVMPPVIFQTVDKIPASRNFYPGTHLTHPKSILYAPKLFVANSTQQYVHEKVERDSIQAFKSAWLLTVPLRRVVLASEVNTQEIIPIGIAEPLPPEKIMPAKEYPYYSPVRKSSMILSLVKATKSTAEANVYAPKVNEFKRKTYYEPELHWAAMRCEYDPSLIEQFTRPMEDLLRPDKAKIKWHRSLLDNKYRTETIKTSYYHVYEEAVGCPVFKIPERYHTFMIMRIINWPLYQVVTAMIQETCLLTNFYCEPTPFKAWAREMHHCDLNNQTQEQANHWNNGLMVATVQTTTFIDNQVELVDIPDVVGDISQIQPLLAKQRDPAKMLIWMEVFKRSVIKARPLYPFVKVCEMLPVAQSRKLQIFNDCTSFTKIPCTIPTARALTTLVSSRPQQQRPQQPAKSVIQYAIEVVHPFMAEATHSYNPLAMKVRAIAQREKAIETTEYIRNYTKNQWSQVLEDQDVVKWDKAPALRYQSFKASVALYMPLNLVEVSPVMTYGCVEEHTETAGPSVINWLSRQPFRKLAPLLHIAQNAKDPPLVGYKNLPKYEFVQDIEETPDVSIQDTEKVKAFPVDPIDTFWFFELDTPKVERKIIDLSTLGATAKVETVVVPETINTDVPIAAPGTFQLFMPDPEMMDRLGDTVKPVEPYKPPEPITEPPEADIEAAGASSDMRSRSASIKRVQIADPPVSGSQSPPKSRAKSGTRIVSYQRPREAQAVTSRPPRAERSKSRNTRAREAVNDRRALDSLTASMRNASEILERRRTEGSSRYVEPSLSPSSHYESRGRTASRYQVPTTSYRSSAGAASSSEAAASSSSGLWGLLDMAQSWLTTHKSRRDRSEERSRYLIRKTKPPTST